MSKALATQPMHTCQYRPLDFRMACQADRNEMLTVRALEREGAAFVQTQIDACLLPKDALQVINESVLRLVGAAVRYGREDRTEKQTGEPPVCTITSRFAGIDV